MGDAIAHCNESFDDSSRASCLTGDVRGQPPMVPDHTVGHHTPGQSARAMCAAACITP